jgi:glycerol-3-phosphate O-acyltransferase / dihydroxyacetone phosphate acyltransferase
MPGKQHQSGQRLLAPWLYDLGLWIFALCLDIFFREVYPRGAWQIPKRGPVIIIAAPHANQFVDSILLMRILKQYAKRRISFLIAEKSMKEPYIGTIAACMGALPVVRAMDNVKPAEGEIYLPDPEKDPTLIRGRGTDFTRAIFMVGGSIILPKVGNESPEQQAIAEILGPEEIRLRRPFKKSEAGHPRPEDLRTGTTFKIAPHIDQSKMFDAVFSELCAGGCIGIFPEGGSHDRPSLLPLKAGAAIIALGTLVREPDCGLSIIPCGMNYFNPNKFRSRAVIEFGNPVQVHPDQIEAFKAGGDSKRNAIGSLLETIQEALAAITQQAPDHDTLMLIQATRRLYKPLRMKLPLPLVIELNRRLIRGYAQFKNEPKVIQLTKAVNDYNRQLRALGIKDHQVEWGNFKQRPRWLVLVTLLYRVGELVVLSLGILPSLALFWPVFLIAKVISVKKQRKALAASVVKIEARDVVGTWKMLVAGGLAPALYTWYTVIATIWLHYCRHDGHYPSVVPWWMNAAVYVPDGIPLWMFSIFFFGLMISVTFAGLRIGEVGMDIWKSLHPLLLALDPRSAQSLVQLRARRQKVTTQVLDVIDTFGPEIFPDFDAERLISANDRDDDTYESQLKTMPISEPETGDRSRGQSSSAEQELLSYDDPIEVWNIDKKDDSSEVNRRIRDSIQRRDRGSSKAQFNIEGDSDSARGPMASGHKDSTGTTEGKKTR